MRKQIQGLLNKYVLVEDDYENVIDFVRDVLELEIERTKNEEPHATVSISKMEVAVSEIAKLSDLMDIDKDIKWIMDNWNIDEDDVQEILDDRGIEANELRNLIKHDNAIYYNSYRDFFDAIHENLDKEDLIDHLYNDTNAKDESTFVELNNGDYVWFPEYN